MLLKIVSPRIVKWTVLSALFFSFLSVSAQRRNGYVGLDAGVYFLKPHDPAVGVHFSGNIELVNALFFGPEIGVVKFDHLKKPYLPLLARFSIMPALQSRKASALIVLAPGYGLHDETYRRGNNWFNSKGGFAFYGGAGAVIPGKKRGSLAITIGYTSFGFRVNGFKSNIDGVGLRLGAMIR